jgi:hypothetical protein
VEAASRSYRQAGDYGKDTAEFLSGFHREDRVLPVITIVIHWGAEPWDAPLSLREMYSEGINPLVSSSGSDYQHLFKCRFQHPCGRGGGRRVQGY